MSFFTREQCLQRLRAQVAAGKPIIGGGAGTGISAKCAEAGGIDLIIIYNSGRFRMAGRGSLSGMMPYGDANQIVMDMAREVLPVVAEDAGAGRRVRHRSVSHHEAVPARRARRRLQRRAELPHRRPDRRHVPPGPGRDRHGLRPGSRHDPPGPRAGPADLPLCLHRGRSRGDGQGRRRRAHPAHGADDQGQHRRQDGADAGRRGQDACRPCTTRPRRSKPDILVLCHGGPISEPEDAQYILENTKGIVGFFGASSIERLPTEVAITGCVKQFKGLKMIVAGTLRVPLAWADGTRSVPATLPESARAALRSSASLRRTSGSPPETPHIPAETPAPQDGPTYRRPARARCAAG